ncbi:MAG: hypothetical protein ACOC8G_02020 [Thermodesulfobacteriota bacterium]
MKKKSASTGRSGHLSAASTRELRDRLRYLIDSPEVLRLVHDVTTCSVAWEDAATFLPDPKASRGLELFPCFTMHFREQDFPVTGAIHPNLPGDGEGLNHVLNLELAGQPCVFRLTTPQTYVLSPFHLRFLSMLFGRLVLQHLIIPLEAHQGFPLFTPYSLEEQVVAGYLQSLRWAPCATIKLDAQDTPYIGSLLHSERRLQRCEMPGSRQEEALIRAWRLFKRLLYYSIEGGPLFTGFAFIPSGLPPETYQKRWPSLLFYREDSRPSFDEGVEAFKQYLLHANGRNTFLALQGGRLVGLLHLARGTHRQLASLRAWNAVPPLTSISSRGRITFWVPLRGRHNPQIPLAVLEYRHGHLRIPLFQDIFWLELERQLNKVCPHVERPDWLLRLKRLLALVRRGGHGAILLLGLTAEQLTSPDTLENQVFLEHPVPLTERYLSHLFGLAKSDGAVLFNDRLEAVAFSARLKAAPLHLPPEQDDLGSGMRHQATREFTAQIPNVVGLAVSQDGYLSLYRHGRLISRLY